MTLPSALRLERDAVDMTDVSAAATTGGSVPFGGRDAAISPVTPERSLSMSSLSSWATSPQSMVSRPARGAGHPERDRTALQRIPRR